MSVFEVSCFVYRVGMCLVCANGCIFFFKQKTAYDMRMRGWSSDVCTSDLKLRRRPMQEPRHQLARFQAQRLRRGGCDGLLRPRLVLQLAGLQMQALPREASPRPVRPPEPAAGRLRIEGLRRPLLAAPGPHLRPLPDALSRHTPPRIPPTQ